MVGVPDPVAAIPEGGFGGRYPASMARRCARPDCAEVASTTLAYEYATSTVWIGPLAEESHPMRHDLCERHADRLRVPQGWQLRDRRDVLPLPLFGRGDALAS